MKTIEERATEYACDDGVMPNSPECESCFNIYGKCTRDAYIAGAKSERKELARWHDPKEVLPEIGKCVLIKVVDQLENEAIYLGSREGDEYMLDGMGDFAVGAYFDDESMPDMNIKVIGWREIL